MGTGGLGGWYSVSLAVAGSEGFELCSNAVFEIFFSLVGGAGYDCENGDMRFANWDGSMLEDFLYLSTKGYAYRIRRLLGTIARIAQFLSLLNLRLAGPLALDLAPFRRV